MRQKINAADLYADALYALPVPTECPVTLDELLGD